MFEVYHYLPYTWTYLVLNYNGQNEGEGITVFHTVNTEIRMHKDTTREQFYRIPSGNGHVTIGNRLILTYHPAQYASLKVDELTFWNRTLSLVDIMVILNMTLQG